MEALLEPRAGLTVMGAEGREQPRLLGAENAWWRQSRVLHSHLSKDLGRQAVVVKWGAHEWRCQGVGAECHPMHGA